MAKILFLVSIMLLSFYLTEQAKSSHDGMISKSDIEAHTVKAEESFGLNSAKEENLMLLGTKGVDTKSKMLYKTRDPRYVIDNRNHKEFDARKRWPKCKTIGVVHNDGNTRWSWAYATTGAFADRMCIATNGNYNKLLSTEELIACSDVTFIGDAWKYFETNGLVSGGKYNTNDGCQPSKMPPIGNIPAYLHKHTCEKSCYGNNTVNYHHDHVKVRNHYNVVYKDIQKEVQTYGPVSVVFALYDDFFLYKSGVYTKTKNAKLIRNQYAKLIGWGVENGVDYWLLVNSWGHEWGQNGLFKIKRGTDECYVESWVYAGEPKIK